ncbi:MAG: hypothetical protein Kow0092_34420 [Deferrisomatales bacterium]
MDTRKPVLRLCGWAVLVAFLAAPAFPAEPDPLGAAAREAGRPLVVRFGLDRCLQCIRQGKAFDALAPRYGDRVEFRMVHVGAEADVAAAYRVLLIPTVLFFDASGEQVFRHVGLLEAPELEREMLAAGLVPPGPSNPEARRQP